MCSVAMTLRNANPDATIAVLTFYKGQLLEIMRKLAAALKVEVLTVDACQGSEFDYVVLSTYGNNLFVPNRILCDSIVLISRNLSEQVPCGVMSKEGSDS